MNFDQNYLVFQILTILILKFIKLANSVQKCSSLFHVNIRSLSKHIDELKNVLHASKIIFDFKGVSETKQLINKDFISDVDIEGYQMYSQPSKSASCGVAIYVNNKLDHFRKDDLLLLRMILNHYGLK